MSISQWGKDVKIALINRDMTAKDLSNELGYCTSTISNVINGRYSNSSRDRIVEEINTYLGTKGMPERTDTASDDWCESVKIALVKKKMSTIQLAEAVGLKRDKLSLIINGKQMDNEAVASICELLEIEKPTPIN